METMRGSESYEHLRPLLFSIAYRMVGSVSEAEDIVQESFLRFHAARRTEPISSPRAYLARVAARLSLNHLNSARVRREQYVGTWLPEPLPTDSSDPQEKAELAESLSMAFLVLLETLAPTERAVFLLREVFGYRYGEIADIVGKSEQNCRQIAARARRYVDEKRPRFEVSKRQREELTGRFLAAMQEGDKEGLLRLLAADAALYADSGGKVPGIARSIHGRDNIVQLMFGLAERAVPGAQASVTELNGHPGVLLLDAAGHVVVTFSLWISDGFVQTIWAIGNPDKLRHLGPVGDLARFLRREP